MSPREDPGQVAEVFMTFCDGVEVAGLDEYARRGRRVARLLISALDRVEAEASARRALQARCELQQELLGERVYGACRDAAERGGR